MTDCKAYREEMEESGGAHGLSLEASAHAGVCPSCDKFGREHGSLRRLVAGLGKVEAPADFEFRLRARMKTEKGGGKYNLLPLRIAPGLAWAAAACIIVVSASLYILQERRNTNISQQASRIAKSGDEALRVVGENRPAESASTIIEEVKVDTPTAIVPVKSAGVNNGRVLSRHHFRAASRNEPRREAASVGSAEFIVTPAKVLRMKIPLSTTPESLRFVVRDERGNTRHVPMRAVSFGSQELVADANARARTIATDKGGVW
ncbi:MAG: hypothetical protein H7Z38_10360 [Rubrivivax sp.]|nr:hypothetical protein [Pyrinomonadaceae bacterium]